MTGGEREGEEDKKEIKRRREKRIYNVKEAVLEEKKKNLNKKQCLDP